MVNVEWHGQDYLHLKWHVVCSGFITPGLDATLGNRQKIKKKMPWKPKIVHKFNLTLRYHDMQCDGKFKT